jgi:hypothetical protein
LEYIVHIYGKSQWNPFVQQIYDSKNSFSFHLE